MEQLLSHSAVRISSVTTSTLLHSYFNNRSKHFLIYIPNRLYFADSILTLSLGNFFVMWCSQDALVVGNILCIVKYETEHGHELYRQEAQRATYRAPEYNVSPFWGIGQGGHFCLLIGPKNTNSEEDVEILLPVKFRWIPFSGFRGEVENVSANQRPGRTSCFSDRPEKHELGRGRWDLASCQVSLNSVQGFQRRSQKCLSQSEPRVAILLFRSAWKTQTW